jgi:DGQHR domain-containing protein
MMAPAAKTILAKNLADQKTLVVPAIEITQGRNRRSFSFAVDGKLLSQFTAVSRVARDDANAVTGYQRPEVLSHISQIRKYLESDNPMLPNAIVVAFDRSVVFESREPPSPTGRVGSLHIPIPEGDDGEKPGLIVDGQQRTAAIREAAIKRFPVFAVGFIARDEDEQREQFVLVNSTKPLPKGLLYELLPSIDAPLPEALARRKLPAVLLNRLNHDTDSPFLGMVSTPTSPKGVVKDNSLLRMIENSLSDGKLYRFRDPVTGECDVEKSTQVLKHYWTAVKDVFPAAWGLPPKRSRLMHGAGIIALGFVMDAVSDRLRSRSVPTKAQFTAGVCTIAEECRWTDGYWQFGARRQVKWSDLQNTPSHIQMLTDHLLSTLREAHRDS